MTELRLILGDQLNPQHSWFSECDDHVIYVMLELRQETEYVLHHAQKLIAVLAAMRNFAHQLRADGHRIRYVTIDDASIRGALEDNLDALIGFYKATSFAWQLPDEWRLDQQLLTWASRQSIQCRQVDTEHFYTARDEAGRIFSKSSHWRMEIFYRQMRRRHRVLLERDGTPDVTPDLSSTTI